VRLRSCMPRTERFDYPHIRSAYEHLKNHAYQLRLHKFNVQNRPIHIIQKMVSLEIWAQNNNSGVMALLVPLK